ncbi:[protein-PII] uridylyltransferase [Nevskia sp.]|uniref:[protein-PII] uridylyltransferase n=1 Tax=Nevskia sp. TaxID=1929292 RepID=UPI0025F5AB8D|nr:[protein-PII] uridylyltransferase [Nevskia sp.]
MAAEIELSEDDSIAVFSARRVRSRLRADGGKPVAAFRETLAWGRERLVGLFHEGTPADSLVHARAHLVDEVLREAWTQFLPQADGGLALIAVGGYGRGELLPHSDIDLLVLFDEAALDAAKSRLENFFAFLWDIGLDVGSAVRSVPQCAELAATDVTVITNLTEARPLIGDLSLFAALTDAMRPEQMWPVDAFFRAKVAEQHTRHAKFDDSAYKLEPNVKESPGGLRDIHTVAWVAKRHFGASSLTELRERGFLTKTECDELFAGQDFLWRVRFALHMITGRHEDRLLFDHQNKIATLFGYEDQDRNRAVEQFMQLYYRTIKSLSCLNDMLLQLFEEAILGRGRDAEVKPLNTRFQTRNNYIEARADDVFQKAPWALIEVFALMQQHPKLEGISTGTLRLIRRDRRLIETVRSDVGTRERFIGMFQHGDGLTRALRRMNRYGVLGRYLPVFGQIIGHMQYDLFHTLTVDEHTLRLVRNLRRLNMERFKHELPFFSDVMAKVPRPDLLFIAGLFHDLGKGSGGDHSEVGAKEAEKFCLDHGLSHADADLVSWLVRNHLLMSLTAQRQDISNPDIVTAFAQKVGDRSRLDYLLVLTVSDIRATNPALWNSWRESLLRELYHSTKRAFDRGLDNPYTLAERVAEQRRAAYALPTARHIDGALTDRIWGRFDADYFLRHSPAELVWHLDAIAQTAEEQLPLVLVKTLDGRGTTVFVYMRDRDHLFGLSTGVLAKLGLNILDARINTSADGYALDSFVVMESDGSPIENTHRFEEIGTALRKVLADPAISVVDVNRRRPTRLRHFDTPTTVSISQDTMRNRTMLELVCADQPGLLSLVGRVFHKRGILLDAAKIATIGERAEDVFYITDRQHQPITSDKALDELREVLTRTLSNAENAHK